jgi:3-isopropylmalate/(R)-2-methylmalate dehydratase small subunit
MGLMESLTTLEGVLAALPRANIDTDLILSAQFMKTTSRRGLGQHLFHALRKDDTGALKADFILNQTPWNEARFLVVLDNFGCGSSREHAPWALLDFGIKCVIAPSFADIFSNNCTKNGILPLTLDRALCDRLITDARTMDTARLKLDLPAQTLTRSNGEEIHFELDLDRKRRLTEGLDEIQITLSHETIIAAHDDRAEYFRPVVPRDIGTARLF